MKIEDCKEGMLVIVHKKSYIGRSIKHFLNISPLGVGTICSIFKSCNRVAIKTLIARKYDKFIFRPEDIEPIEKEERNGLSKNE